MEVESRFRDPSFNVIPTPRAPGIRPTLVAVERK